MGDRLGTPGAVDDAFGKLFFSWKELLTQPCILDFKLKTCFHSFNAFHVYINISFEY